MCLAEQTLPASSSWLRNQRTVRKLVVGFMSRWHNEQFGEQADSWCFPLYKMQLCFVYLLECSDHWIQQRWHRVTSVAGPQEAVKFPFSETGMLGTLSPLVWEAIPCWHSHQAQPSSPQLGHGIEPARPQPPPLLSSCPTEPQRKYNGYLKHWGYGRLVLKQWHKLESRCWEKYQQPQICRWYHSNGRK